MCADDAVVVEDGWFWLKKCYAFAVEAGDRDIVVWGKVICSRCVCVRVEGGMLCNWIWL